MQNRPICQALFLSLPAAGAMSFFYIISFQRRKIARLASIKRCEDIVSVQISFQQGGRISLQGRGLGDRTLWRHAFFSACSRSSLAACAI